jgi:hypothetical protein
MARTKLSRAVQGRTAQPAQPAQQQADEDPAAAPADRVGALVARLSEPGGSRRADPRALGGLSAALVGSGQRAGRASVGGGRWLTELFLDVVPRVPIRDLETLRAHHPGLEADDLAQALTSGASKATAAVGAAGGALASIEFAALPTLLTAPAQIAAETLLVGAIEVKLIAELHEVYGRVPAGSSSQRTAAYVVSWTNRRGVDPSDPVRTGVTAALVAKTALRRRLMRRAALNITTLGPMLSGAVAGSVVNHRETRRLADEIRADLRRLSRRR